MEIKRERERDTHTHTQRENEIGKKQKKRKSTGEVREKSNVMEQLVILTINISFLCGRNQGRMRTKRRR